MLFSIDGKLITSIPKRRMAFFDSMMNNLNKQDPKAYINVAEALNEYIDSVPKDNPIFSSFVPGSDWTGTPYQPLYFACNQNKEHSGWLFGLILWQIMINRSDSWIFKPSDKDDDILGTTYFRKN